MAYNSKKILQVLHDELGEVPERVKGYREELGHLLGDVLIFSKEHIKNRTNVNKKIADQVNKVGILVYKSRVNETEKDL